MSEEIIEEVAQDEIVEDVKVTPEVEAKALKMGWTPKDEFKGDPDKWRPADEFVERGENMLPIVKAQVKRQEKEILELKEAMKQFGEYHTKTETRAYEKAMLDLKQQRADAIAAGDGVAFDKVDDQLNTLRQEIESKGKQESKQTDATLDPVYIEWVSRNKWVEDKEMEMEARDVAENLIAIGVKSSGAAFLDRVKEVMKMKHPEKFENKRRESAPTVEGGSPAPRRGGKSYADLPADAKAACDRMAKNAYSDKPKEIAAFKAEYTKNYFEEA
jgi:hypothetical protein